MIFLKKTVAKIASFLFSMHLEKDVLPIQAKVTLAALYAMFVLSIFGIIPNLMSDYRGGLYNLAFSQIIYLFLLLVGMLSFWKSRRLHVIRYLFGSAFLALIFALFLNRGGLYGFGFLYFLAGYSILYYILGFLGGTLVPLFIYVCVLFVLLAPPYAQEPSLLANPEYAVPYVMVFSIATALGIVSVIFQHIVVRRLFRIAYEDEVSGVASRKKLELHIQEQINFSKIYFMEFSLIAVRLDHFAQLNSAHGTRFTDYLLKVVGQRIQEQCLKDDIVCRYSGPVFMILSKDNDFELLQERGEALVRSVQNPVQENSRSIRLPASASITVYPGDGTSVEKLVSNIMANFSYAKDPSGIVRFYNAEQHSHEVQKYAMKGQLRNALERNELSLVFHPKICLDDMRCCGAEILLRWNNRIFGAVGPDEFIPLAEEAALINELTRWLTETSFLSLAKIRERFPDEEYGFIHAINLSPLDLSDPDFSDFLQNCLKKYSQHSQFIELEITEGVLMQEDSVIDKTLSFIRQTGFRLAIDDFGTGYSNLNYLHKLKAQNLKIDKSFIMAINESGPEAPIVDAIISMAKSLNMDITAEGVETPFQEAYVKNKGCTAAQGFLYTKPMFLEEYIQWLKRFGKPRGS